MKNATALILFFMLILGVMTLAGCNHAQSNTPTTQATTEQATTVLVETTVACIDIETGYAILKLPEEWKDTVSSQVIDGEGGYTVSFLGKVNGKDNLHLCDLYFGIDEGDLLGYLSVDGEAVPLSIKYYSFDESFEADEKEELQRMQTGVEYVIDNLVDTNQLTLSE